jgi:hypothetical protein
MSLQFLETRTVWECDTSDQQMQSRGGPRKHLPDARSGEERVH